ncbi:hypothetical protein LTR78_006207 [Recurvomyces mirabilis]|uniref:Erythromycin biosynthesis protein CIII-like C-terminal domain-containing protein n=1 Tax=Recurvomyces mirabilis TaxID=574656 RepID=A0AAE1C0M0_9PEZI|nr:hypothetical protein LTR78_006207 [Recurvomyces mirabilis]KAK5152048.1 hypothetical protein LTS14_008822 [Recurvomyces mirabilis]
MPSLLNGPDTDTICFQEINRVLEAAGYNEHDDAQVSRRPVVFMGNAIAGTGDVLPFMRIITELPQHLEAEYHILLLCTRNMQWLVTEVQDQLQAMDSNITDSITFYSSLETWVRALEEASMIDAVVVNQADKWARPEEDDGHPLLWTRMIDAVVLGGSALLQMEFMWLNTRKTDFFELEKVCRGRFPRLSLQCYPAWLLADEERDRTAGVLCGAVEPFIPSAANMGQPGLEEFFRAQQGQGRKVVMLARGGRASPARFAFDAVGIVDGPPDVVKDLLTLPDIAVLLLGGVKSEFEQLAPRLFTVPYLKVDFRQIFARVDVVVHHGGTGTTFTALKCGTPQIIVCNKGDCPDQETQARKVSELLCGRFLQSRESLSDASTDVVDAVEDAVLNHRRYKVWCDKAQAKMVTEEILRPSLVVRALQRLTAGVVSLKEAGKWEGWTQEVIAKDNEYADAMEKMKAQQDARDKIGLKTQSNG